MTVQTTGYDLVLAGVTKLFGEVKAVDGVSLSVRPGEFYSLLGPSGCGKTTTLRIVAGFERPDAGTVTVAHQDVTAAPPNRRPVNTVFQHYALFPHMTVEDNVGYGLRQKKMAKSEVSRRLADALRTVRLEELRSRYPRELSGGQQQRVALARALINEPTVLLLDEPLAALDLKLRKAMQVELKSLQERVGISFVYVTHDQEEALTLSDRIAVMDGGRIVQEGSPEDIYDRPANRFVADFIGQTNLLRGVVEDPDIDGCVLVRVGDLLVKGVCDQRLERGLPVWVSVRPEQIRPAAAAPHAPNRVSARIHRRLYLGGTERFEVQLVGGPRVIVEKQLFTDIDAVRWNEGDSVEIAWESDRTLVLPDEGSEIAGEADRALVDQER